LSLGLAISPSIQAQDCPELLGWLAQGPLHAVAVSGDIAVVGGYSLPVLQVLDVSTPADPQVRGELQLPEGVNGLAISGSHAFVANGESGLRVIDISTPATPTEVGILDTPGDAMTVVVSGGLAYVADEEGGLRIIDVSRPSDPFEVGSFSQHVWDVAVSGGIAYLAGSWGGLRLIDVSTPSVPIEIGALDLDRHYAVAVSGGFAFISNAHYFRVIDVSTPSEPFEVGILDTAAWDIEIASSGIAYLASHHQGLRVIDVSTPSSPAEVGFFDSPDKALDVAVSGDLAYIADDTAGLRVVDVSFPAVPHEIGSFDATLYASAVAVSGDVAYVASGSHGLHLINVSSLSSPFVTGKHPDWASVVAVSGRYLYVGAGSGLRVFDITSPETPVEVGYVETPWGTCGGNVDVTVEGDLVFTLCDHSGLSIFDVSRPDAPVHVGSFDTYPYPRAVAAEGDFVFVLDDYALLRVIDVTSPEAPQETGTFDMWSASDILVSDGLVYVACGSEGLRIIDVSTPSAPTEVAVLSSSVPIRSIAEWGTNLLASGGIYGSDTGTLSVIDVSTPSEPVEVCTVDTQGVARDLVVSDGRIFSAENYHGLRIFRVGEHIYYYWLDNAAHVSGLFGSEWRTDVVTKNQGSDSANVEFRLHSIDHVQPFSNSVSVGDQGTFEDVVGLMGYEGKGCLEVRSSEPLQVSGRIFNRTDEGTFGQYVEAFRSGTGLGRGEVAALLQLRQNEGEFRTNISITNTGDETASVRVRLYNGSGDRLKVYRLDIDPKSLLQDPEPFKRRAGQPDLGWGFAEIEVVSGAGILASASVVDSVTNDATTIPAKR